METKEIIKDRIEMEKSIASAITIFMEKNQQFGVYSVYTKYEHVKKVKTGESIFANLKVSTEIHLL